MKLQKIILENITSLKGRHIIDFDKIDQLDSIFAITGATGAGKSSILQAVTLALYGRTYKSNLTQPEFITLGSDFGQIELHFNILQNNYYIFWNCRIAKSNGLPLKKPQIEKRIYKNDILCNEPIEDILQLTFDQFCKTTILNQGQFANFVTSTFTKRKEIIEKLYPGIDLLPLSALLKSKIKNLNNDLTLLSSQLENLSPYSSEQIIGMKKELKDLELLQKEYRTNELLITEINVNYSNFNNALNKYIETDLKIPKHKDNFENITLELKKQSNNLNKTNDDFKNAKDTLNTQSPKLLEAIALQQNIQNQKQNIFLLNHKADETKLKIKNNEQRQHTIQNHIKETQKEIALNENVDLLPGLKIKEIDKILILTKDFLNLQQIRQTIKVQVCEQEIKNKETSSTLIKTKKHLKEIEISLNINDINDIDKTLKTNLLSFETQLKTIEQQYDNLNVLFNNVQLTIDTLTKIYNKNQSSNTSDGITVNISDIKQTLKNIQLPMAANICHDHSIKNKKCIVCSNPMSADTNAPYPMNDVLAKLNHTSATLENKISTAKNKKVNQQQKITTFQTQLEKRTSINIEVKDLTTSYNYELGQLAQKTKDLKITDFKLNDLQNKINEIYKTVPSNGLLTDLQQKKETIYQIETLKNKLSLYYEQIKSSKKENSLLTDDIKSLNTQKLEMESNINLDSKTLFSISQHSDPKELLAKLKSNFDQLNSRLNNLKNHCHKIEIDKNSIYSQLVSLDDQKDALIKEFTYELLAAQKKTNKFIDSKNSSNDLSYDYRIFEKILSIEPNISNPSILETTDILKEVSKNLINIINNIKETLENLILKKSDILAKINFSNNLQQQKRAIIDDITLYKNELEKLNNLDVLIGKDGFRNYVLSFIEQLLIKQTNTELNYLCDGRYSLVQEIKNNSSELFIYDLLNDGLKRKISTLSGGETFLLSLAMALSLAELTRGNAILDSFFIDEGFGNLDNDSLDEAYYILSNLRSRGKQIGIISHIETLTSKIPVNIQVLKGETGDAKIKIHYN